MEFLKAVDIKTAREQLLERAKKRGLSVDHVPLDDALGRILAEDVFTTGDIPAFRRSTVDGYAVVSPDTAAAGDSIPVFLKLKGRVEMGRTADFSIVSGECAEVPTGAMLPGGADAVIMCEYAEMFGTDGVALGKGAHYGENVILPGEDAKAGDNLLRRGVKLLPQDIGALAAAGITFVPVFAPIRTVILSTGDELIPPNETPAPGQVRDINTYALAALARKHGVIVTNAAVLPDDQALIEEAVSSSMDKNDIVVISGGSSKGTKDLTKDVFDRLASPGVFVHGIALKPGKPTILGCDDKSCTLLIGLPGHPVSAMIVFELLIGWLLRELTGSPAPLPIPAKLSCNIASSPGKLCCWPCRLTQNGGEYTAEPVFGKSGLITTLTQADGYFTVERNAEGLATGSDVMVYLFN